MNSGNIAIPPLSGPAALRPCTRASRRRQDTWRRHFRGRQAEVLLEGAGEMRGALESGGHRDVGDATRPGRALAKERRSTGESTRAEAGADDDTDGGHEICRGASSARKGHECGRRRARVSRSSSPGRTSQRCRNPPVIARLASSPRTRTHSRYSTAPPRISSLE